MHPISPDRIESTSGLIIAGLQRRFAPGHESEIADLWLEFVPQMDKIPEQVPGVTYGVCLGFDPQSGILYLSGVETTLTAELPEGFDRITLPPREYAVFTHHGHYSLLPQTFEAIGRDWAPTVTNAAFDQPSFERYSSEFNPETGEGGTEVWFPLSAQS